MKYFVTDSRRDSKALQPGLELALLQRQFQIGAAQLEKQLPVPLQLPRPEDQPLGALLQTHARTEAAEESPAVAVDHFAVFLQWQAQGAREQLSV